MDMMYNLVSLYQVRNIFSRPHKQVWLQSYIPFDGDNSQALRENYNKCKEILDGNIQERSCCSEIEARKVIVARKTTSLKARIG